MLQDPGTFSRQGFLALIRICWQHTLRHECLDWLVIFSERHLRQVLGEFCHHYNRARPHRGRDLRPPHPDNIPARGAIVRTGRLHGLINEYSRAA